MDYNKVRNSKKKKNGSGVKIIAAVTGAAVVIILAAAAIIYYTQIKSPEVSVPEETTIASSPEPTAVPEEYELPVDYYDPATATPRTNSVYEPAAAPQQHDPYAGANNPQPGAPVSRRGTAVPIPENIREEMAGVSMPDYATISYDELRYLTIPHYDFNGRLTEGHMVVNAAVAEEVLDIFAELVDIGYPIERMDIVDKYGGSDYDSIDDNNTSAFNYRLSTDGLGNLSNHARGLAIDINPQINPYVNSDGTGSHPNAEEYWSRDVSEWSDEVDRQAYIGPDSEIYDIFVNEHGWEWGGSWSSYRDYQHFEKPF